MLPEAAADHDRIRVALVTPAGAVRAGLQAMLTAEDGIQIVAALSSLEHVEDVPAGCDVLVAIPAALREIDLAQLAGAFPGIGLLILVSDPVSRLPFEGMPALRAWGVLSLEADGAVICAAARAVHEGLQVAQPELLDLFSGQEDRRAAWQNEGEALTPRESEVLQQLALGLTNKQIALALGMSEHTAKYHISSIYSKLGVLNRAEAVREGVRRGWLRI